MFDAMLKHSAIVIGVSTGGTEALTTLLPALPADLFAPVTIVMHVAQDSDGFLSRHLDNLSDICVKEAEDGEPLKSGTVYLAPAGYHLLIEEHRCFALSVDDPVRYSRPSIDVLFESAAETYRDELIGIVLTGANGDGRRGLEKIKAHGGFVIVQEPKTAVADVMPNEALAAVEADQVLPLQKIGPFLERLHFLRFREEKLQ